MLNILPDHDRNHQMEEIINLAKLRGHNHCPELSRAPAGPYDELLKVVAVVIMEDMPNLSTKPAPRRSPKRVPRRGPD
jgi:hypothetical protein